MNHAVIGLGEVGRAHAQLLGAKFHVWEKDICEKPDPDFHVDAMHIALDFHGMGPAKWIEVVDGYLKRLKPSVLSVLSTVSPGTTECFGPTACHSTTRGLHPNLKEGLLRVPKHIGGPMAERLAKDFQKAGMRCVTHGKSRTTELLHILNNSHYGVNLMFADEAAKLCRDFGVDYFEYMKYTATHNEGFTAMDHPRLVRPILTPPNGRIGGHCVTQGATLIPDDLRGDLISKLAAYGGSDAGGVRGVRQDGAALPVDGVGGCEAGGEPGRRDGRVPTC